MGFVVINFKDIQESIVKDERIHTQKGGGRLEFGWFHRQMVMFLTLLHQLLMKNILTVSFFSSKKEHKLVHTK